MKKALVFFCLLVALLCSCAVTEKPVEITMQDADYALHIAGLEALKTASSKIKSSIQKNIGELPEEFKSINDLRYDIPGLNTILINWSNYIKSYLESAVSKTYEEMNMYVQAVKFEDPLKMLEDSDSSASQLFLKEYGNVVTNFFRSMVFSADYSLLEKAVKQYNSYISSQNFLYKTDMPELVFEAPIEYFAVSLTEIFRNLLLSSEELYRTTPDPYKDSIAAVVFAIE